MTSSINPINVNTQGIGGAHGFGAKPKAEKEEVKEEAKAALREEKSSVPADKVLDFLAQSSVSVTPKKALDPAKYVDEASAKRIAGFMADFEDKVAEGLKAFDEEFKGANVNENTRLAVVLAKVEKETV